MIQGIIEILSEDATLCALVGDNKAATKPKFYWVVAGDEEKVPYIILVVTGNLPTNVKDQPSMYDQISFDCYIYARSVEQADDMDQAIRLALEQKTITTDAGFYFHRIVFNGQKDGYDKEAQKPFRLTSFIAHVKRDIPT